MSGRIVYVLSFARCGHHAVMNWICDQAKPALYFNNCDIKDKKVIATTKIKYNGAREKIKNKNGFDIETEIENINLCLINHINIDVPTLYAKLGRSDIDLIVVVRDIYNWVASRYRYGGNVRKTTQNALGPWKNIISSCLYKKDVKEDTNFIDVNFNRWFSEYQYRKRLAKKLGIPFTDKGLNFTNHIGQSRFEPDTNDGQNLGVLNRYTHIDKDDIRKYIDEESIKLSEEYFNTGIIL